MERLGGTTAFSEKKNLVLEGVDPVTRDGFTQVPNFILRDPELSIGAKMTLSALLSYAWHNDYVFPGQERLAKDLGAGKRSVIRYMKELEAAELLTIVRRGLRRTNIYTLRFTVKKKRHPKR